MGHDMGVNIKAALHEPDLDLTSRSIGFMGDDEGTFAGVAHVILPLSLATELVCYVRETKR